MKLFTIGTSGKGLRRFAGLLKDAGVDCVIDIRLNNNSQLAGYAKKDDLSFALELIGIAYERHPELAPDEETLEAYRKDKDWEAYVTRFEQLMENRDMLAVGKDILSHWQRPCLLCSEDDPAKCHRRLVAESWAEGLAGVEIEHLG